MVLTNPFDLNLVPTPSGDPNEFPIIYNTSIKNINYITEYGNNEYVPNYIIELLDLSYLSITKNLIIQKTVGVYNDTPSDGDIFIIKYNSSNAETATLPTYYQYNSTPTAPTATMLNVPGTEWEIKIEYDSTKNKCIASINTRNYGATSSFSTDGSNIYWALLVSIISKNIDVLINRVPNRDKYKDAIGNNIDQLLLAGVVSDSSNIYKYIAFDQCRALNNLGLCAFAKNNLATCATNMNISSDTLLAFCNTFDRSHFVRLLYLFDRTSAPAGTPVVNPLLKISIYAKTIFSYNKITPNNNVLRDEADRTVLIKYTKV